ncbi:MAG: hypothetical protein IKB58_02560, partial [Oscillospiraceae bacterium]|nr:hypothetical protein [Oscillospiraceae bacterium]
MKAKRLFALLLSFVMVISMLPGTALAAEEPAVELKVAEETLAGKDGLAVELAVTTDANYVNGVSVSFTFDKTMLDVVDAEGNVIELGD